MANNIDVKDAAGLVQTVKTTQSGGVHTPHQNAQIQVAGADVSSSNRVPVATPDLLEVTGSVSSAAVLFSQDTTNYQSVCVQVTSAGSATITYEASNDNTTWYAVAGYTPLNTGSTGPVTTSTTAILLVFPCLARYFRARVSSYTSGTVSVVAEFRKDAISGLGVNAVVNNAANSAVPIAFNGTVAPASSATGAATKARVKSAASTNATSVKGSAGRLYEIHLCNTSAALKFVKFYNKASAPTVGTDTPVATYPLAANGGRVDVVSVLGISFATGIAYAITGAVADTDTTAVAADDVHGELIYA